ncbi:MAG TPA: Stk1 family PASTA domain-containing Ser/Thr kinase [Pseudonocardiaceae bacterium]|nr:Stk1 family PASTA domain-containing Ser/Thr kinase [Pseudonocardiaceae bacterium]
MTTPRLLSERYELGEVLGYGGMSEVHRAKDARLGRDVAVKVLRADLARDPQFQLRFRREAQNAASLNHPAIVAVYDTGETQTEFGPLPYIVMEYVDGRTLRDIVKRDGPMDEQQAIETMADVCAALDFSHRGGIIHRDVKPANVMITTAGAVKVMDFGIARALADGAGVTQTAAVIGTAQYLSPEQARGESVDARSDVYAAGCVLYELLTGSPPFTGDSPVAVAYQHVREDPKRPSQENPDVSPALDAVVLRSMSKNPANRYQSAAEMRSDLVRVLAGQRPQAPMVMTDDDRTRLLAAGTAEAGPGRHRPGPADEDGRRGRKGPLVLAGLVAVGLLTLLLLLFTNLFGGGPPQVAVPQVVGEPFEAAQVTLDRAGFQVDREDVPSTVDQLDRVVSTNPAGGAQADRGSTVLVRVGSGPAQVEVPNLNGLRPEEARRALDDVGLALSGNPAERVVEDENQVGRVVASDPPAGQQVAVGTPVVITLGVAPELVKVPNVVGTNVDQARSNVEGADLRVQIQDVDSADPQGQVVDQDPDGGVEVEAGSTVTLIVSRGNLLQMPDLRGLTQQQAQRTLSDLGWNGQLTVRRVQVSDGSQIGRVVGQDVPPGSTFTPDQTITIDIGADEDGATTTNAGGLPGLPGLPGFP